MFRTLVSVSLIGLVTAGEGVCPTGYTISYDPYPNCRRIMAYGDCVGVTGSFVGGPCLFEDHSAGIVFRSPLRIPGFSGSCTGPQRYHEDWFAYTSSGYQNRGPAGMEDLVYCAVDVDHSVVSLDCPTLSLSPTDGRTKWCPSETGAFMLISGREPVHFNFTDITGHTVLQLYRHGDVLDLLDTFELDASVATHTLRHYSPSDLGNVVDGQYAFFAECETSGCGASMEYASYTVAPSAAPTGVPSSSPSSVPTASPTKIPTAIPTAIPTSSPTQSPTTQMQLERDTCLAQKALLATDLAGASAEICAMEQWGGDQGTTVDNHIQELMSLVHGLSVLRDTLKAGSGVVCP